MAKTLNGFGSGERRETVGSDSTGEIDGFDKYVDPFHVSGLPEEAIDLESQVSLGARVAKPLSQEIFDQVEGSILAVDSSGEAQKPPLNEALSRWLWDDSLSFQIDLEQQVFMAYPAKGKILKCSLLAFSERILRDGEIRQQCKLRGIDLSLIGL